MRNISTKSVLSIAGWLMQQQGSVLAKGVPTCANQAPTPFFQVKSRALYFDIFCGCSLLGPFGPYFFSSDRWSQGLQLLLEAIDQAGHKGKILIGSDPASSEFWKEKEQVYVRNSVLN